MKTHSVKFTAWEVVQPDGAGMHSEHIAYFSNLYDAQKCVAQSQHWPRSYHQVTIDKSWIVCDSIEELDQLALENTKAAALAKLTTHERKLLGLE